MLLNSPGEIVIGRLSVILSFVVLFPAVVDAQHTSAPAEVKDQVPDLEQLSQLVRDLMLRNVPLDYENTRQWGGQREVWDGLKVSRDGLRIKTKRRKKLVNHGTWKRYRTWLVEPRESLRVQVSELKESSTGGLQCVLTLQSPLEATGRLSEWRWDVQLFSFSVHARARVTLRLRCDVGLGVDFRHLPPDLVLHPVVCDVQIDLDEFRLLRISDASGPLVRELGDSLRGVLQEENDQRRERSRQKLNQEVQEHSDRLRLSVVELAHWDRVEEWLEKARSEEPQ